KLLAAVAHVAVATQYRADEMAEIAGGVKRQRAAGVGNGRMLRPHARIVGKCRKLVDEGAEVAEQAATHGSDERHERPFLRSRSRTRSACQRCRRWCAARMCSADHTE